MRSAIIQLTVLTLFALLASAHAEARGTESDKLLCKQVRDALAAGRTMDQIIAELHTDADHVAKCVQPRARRGTKRKTSTSGAGKTHKGAAPSASAAKDRAPESDASTSPPPRSRSAVGHVQP